MECSFAFEGTPLKISLETDPALPEIDLTAPGKSAVGDFDLEVEVQQARRQGEQAVPAVPGVGEAGPAPVLVPEVRREGRRGAAAA